MSELNDDPQPSATGAPEIGALTRTRRLAGENLDVILDIELPLTVRFGYADLTLHAISQLGPGSVVELARSPEDPVEIVVNGRVIARGEVVSIGGNYGVRITEVVSAADRLSTIGQP